MANAIKCRDCKNYDPIGSGVLRGRCVPRSTYPAKENPGQEFPQGAVRAAHGEPANVEVVVGNGVIPGCVLVDPIKKAVA